MYNDSIFLHCDQLSLNHFANNSEEIHDDEPILFEPFWTILQTKESTVDLCIRTYRFNECRGILILFRIFVFLVSFILLFLFKILCFSLFSFWIIFRSFYVSFLLHIFFISSFSLWKIFFLCFFLKNEINIYIFLQEIGLVRKRKYKFRFNIMYESRMDDTLRVFFKEVKI